MIKSVAANVRIRSIILQTISPNEKCGHMILSKMINIMIAHSIFSPPYLWILRRTIIITTVRFGSCHNTKPSSGRLNSNFNYIPTMWTTIRYVTISIFISPTLSYFLHGRSTRTFHKYTSLSLFKIRTCL